MRNFEGFLLEADVLSEGELEMAAAESRQRGVRLWQTVFEGKRIDPEVFTETYAAWARVPRLRLATAPPAADALARVPEKVARQHWCVPISVEGNRLVLAMVDPLDLDAIRDVEFASSLRVHPVAATPQEISDANAHAYAPAQRVNEFMSGVPDVDFTILGAPEPSEDDAHLHTDAAPVVRLCRSILFDAVSTGASDVHIEPSLAEVLVRLRVDGVLRDYLRLPKWLHASLVSRLKVIARLDIAEKRLPQDGRFDVTTAGRRYDIRVSTLPTHFGEKVVLRVLGGSAVAELENLGIAPPDLAILQRALAQPQGTILVTGPTGAGKSTTLYALLRARSSPGVNLVSVEDPIEQRVEGVNQVQVNHRAGLTFAGTLRAILRQDPDVILLGEIRDKETAEIAFQAALTGHLVLTTLHTTGAVQTITRLRDLGLDASLVSSSLSVLVAQRLARRLCPSCRVPVSPTDAERARFRIPASIRVIYRSAGCEQCDMAGFRGRVGLYEVVPVNATLRDRIHAGAGEGDLRRAAEASGARTLLTDAVEKVSQGITSLDEVARVIQLDDAPQRPCPNCRAALEPEFAMCPFCLHSFRQACESCGQELRPEWKACPYCRTPAAQPEIPAGPAAPQPQAHLPAARRLKILVVDDDPVLRTITSAAIQKVPFDVEVVTAENGRVAVEMAQAEPPDVVLLDLMMPEMDGFETCARLRANLRTAFVPILMLTAESTEEARTRGFMVGTDDYIQKPYAIPELIARVTRLIRRTYGM